MKQQIANILFIISGLLWGAELIPQIRKTLKRKSVKDISFMFYLICFVAYFIYFIGAYLIAQWFLIIAHIPSVILIAVMLMLIIKYGGKDEK